MAQQLSARCMVPRYSLFRRVALPLAEPPVAAGRPVVNAVDGNPLASIDTHAHCYWLWSCIFVVVAFVARTKFGAGFVIWVYSWPPLGQRPGVGICTSGLLFSPLPCSRRWLGYWSLYWTRLCLSASTSGSFQLFIHEQVCIAEQAGADGGPLAWSLPCHGLAAL